MLSTKNCVLLQNGKSLKNQTQNFKIFLDDVGKVSISFYRTFDRSFFSTFQHFFIFFHFDFILPSSGERANRKKTVGINQISMCLSTCLSKLKLFFLRYFQTQILIHISSFMSNNFYEIYYTSLLEFCNLYLTIFLFKTRTLYFIGL